MKKVVATFLLCASISSMYGGPLDRKESLEGLKQSRKEWEQQGLPLNDHYQAQIEKKLAQELTTTELTDAELTERREILEAYARMEMIYAQIGLEEELESRGNFVMR